MILELRMMELMMMELMTPKIVMKGVGTMMGEVLETTIVKWEIVLR